MKTNENRENKSGIMEVVFILDRSGSMSGLEADTIGGFNSMLQKQKKESENVIWSTVLFDDRQEVIHSRVPIEKVEPLTEDSYYVRGCTALLDAIGRAVHHIGMCHKYLRAEDVPEKTLFIITTDGMENASHRYSAGQVKQMIRHEQEKYGWEFIFLAANIDAVETAKSYGIDAKTAVNYMPDVCGTTMAFEAINLAVGSARSGARLNRDQGWRRSADRDYQKRKK